MARARHRLGSNEIGTTRRGIGPAYMDKASRMGLRIQDLTDEHIFRKKVEAALLEKNDILSKVYGMATYTVDEIVDEYMGYAERIRPHIADTSLDPQQGARVRSVGVLRGCTGHAARHRPRHLPVRDLARRAPPAAPARGRASGLVTSTACSASRRPTSLESAPARSRPSCYDETGELLQKVGGEWGTTTGRQRRCGWYDGVIVRYAVQVNGLTDLVITKLDVLSAVDTIKVCVAYEYEGKRYNNLPCHQTAFHHAKPIYEELPGWGDRHHRAAAPSTSCPRRRATTSASSRTSPKCRCR